MRALHGLVAMLVACAGCSDTHSTSVTPVASTGGGAGMSTSNAGTTSISAGGGAGDGGHATAMSSGSGGVVPAGSGGNPNMGGAIGGSGNQGTPTGAGGGSGGNMPGAGGSSGMAGASTAGSGGAIAAASKLPPVTTTDGPGPFQTAQDLATGPKGQSGLFRPTELGVNGLKHPVFVWGCGGTATPASYANELNRIASHGFVVIAEVENIGDNGTPLLAAADWIAAENTRQGSILYQKLDTSKLGLGGHSIGSVNAFIAGTDPRWTTTIHVAGGSLDNVNDPNAPTTGKGGKALIHPAAYVCAANDAFGNVEKTQKDYDNTTVPVFFTIISGADHLTAVTAGLPAIVAWLRWQLGGETERRSSFLDAQGEFQTGQYMSRVKNW